MKNIYKQRITYGVAVTLSGAGIVSALSAIGYGELGVYGAARVFFQVGVSAAVSIFFGHLVKKIDAYWKRQKEAKNACETTQRGMIV